MAFPTVQGTAESSVNTAGPSHLVTLPANIAATDLVLITMATGSTSATLNALTDWGEILDEAVANGLKILRYTGAGVPSNPTFTSSANTRSASIAWRISGANKSITPEIGSTATGTSATPDPPASAAPGSTKDYLFIAFAGMAGEEADDDTWGNTPPANYTPSPPLQKACGTAGTNLGGLILAASRQLNTGVAENPGAFGVDVSAAWRAQTILIHPIVDTAVTPTAASLTTNAFAPTVTVTNNVLVTPTTAALTTTAFAPTVSTPRLVTPTTAALTLTTFAPAVTGGSGTVLTPATAALTTAAFAPTVTATDNKTVTPTTAALTLTTFAPAAATTEHRLVTPSPASLTLTTFAPTVEATGAPEPEPDEEETARPTYGGPWFTPEPRGEAQSVSFVVSVVVPPPEITGRCGVRVSGQAAEAAGRASASGSCGVRVRGSGLSVSAAAEASGEMLVDNWRPAALKAEADLRESEDLALLGL